ncbi:hypothetical protein [Synechococcus sp. PCC 6312]|uniref:hypothetical protein n=1 Tax=Synechococcus sp. (strain ATCC 27167 / PCC 6312) TaxID=195253 RepID=UPI00029EDB88|nr:hypothetical protein [Synechococcus sp. PCC 6312]AFY61977.1 hypothetical protein Syn6312_2914 [Synechococcus sp. PCC 6312]
METVLFCQGSNLPESYKQLLTKTLLEKYYRIRGNAPLLSRPYLKVWEIELEAKTKNWNAKIVDKSYRDMNLGEVL